MACEASGGEAATFETERQKFAVWKLLRKFGIFDSGMNRSAAMKEITNQWGPFLFRRTLQDGPTVSQDRHWAPSTQELKGGVRWAG